MQTKTCAKCGESKTEDKFYIFLNTKALRKNCKACQAVIAAEYWDKTHPSGSEAETNRRNLLRERGPCPPEHKWCFECDAYLHVDLFCKANKKVKGRMCREHKLLYACARGMEKKKAALEYCGGARCAECDYTGHYAAFDFHHKEPSKKEFDWAHYLNKLTLENAKQELDKCMVLCRNCHMIVHSKLNDDGTLNPTYVPKAGDLTNQLSFSLKKYKNK